MKASSFIHAMWTDVQLFPFQFNVSQVHVHVCRQLWKAQSVSTVFDQNSLPNAVQVSSSPSQASLISSSGVRRSGFNLRMVKGFLPGTVWFPHIIMMPTLVQATYSFFLFSGHTCFFGHTWMVHVLWQTFHLHAKFILSCLVSIFTITSLNSFVFLRLHTSYSGYFFFKFFHIHTTLYFSFRLSYFLIHTLPCFYFHTFVFLLHTVPHFLFKPLFISSIRSCWIFAETKIRTTKNRAIMWQFHSKLL